jgi:hypothetical protein
MQAKTYIKKHEIIGERVRSVFRLNLELEENNQFCLFVIELESGLRFALERESGVIDPLTNYGLIYPYLSVETDMFGIKASNIIWEFKLELDTSINPNLDRPIQAVFLPNGAEYFCGLALENGFVMCDGFFPGGNVLAFHKPKRPGKLDEFFELPGD